MTRTPIRRKTVSKGRHPMLKVGSLAFEIYTLLRQKKALTYHAIADTLGYKPQSVNGMLQRMKGEGIIATSQQQKGNRVTTVYLLADGNENGD